MKRHESGDKSGMKILAIALNPTIDISSEAEHIEPVHKVRTHKQRWDPGGGGVNVARVLAKLGERPRLLIFSGDATGKMLEHILEAFPIDVDAVPVSHPTRIAFMVHELNTGFEYRFVPEGPVISSDELESAYDVVRNFKGEFIIASGSLPHGVPDDTYAEMAKIAAGNGVKFVLDTSGDPLKATLEKASVFLVKPSRHELESYAGQTLSDEEMVDVAKSIVREGKAENVAVTLGEEGALLARAEGVLQLPAIPVHVDSAVGAGDSFVAAMVWYMTQGHSVEDAFRFGLAAGAAAAMTPGTELCSKDDIFQLFEVSQAQI